MEIRVFGFIQHQTISLLIFSKAPPQDLIMVVIHKIPITLACLASIAAAVPTTAKPASKFSVNQVSRPATKTANFAGSYGRALSRYGASVPSHVEAAAAASGSAVTTPESGDVEYLTPVSVGGTTLNLDFDTGSADL